MNLPHATYRELAELIHEESGIVLGEDRAYLVRHRLEPLIRAEKLAGFEELITRMRARGSLRLRGAVINAITVKETRFFRDPDFFDALKQHVLSTLLSAGQRRVRIWSAATAMGQEAYSVAMLVLELTRNHAADAKQAAPCTILGSDISPEAIDIAKAAEYSKSEIRRGLSDARRQSYFTQHGERFVAVEALRKVVHFRTFNLLHSPTEVGEFDLILCRNVLIYFDDATRRRIVHGMFGALHSGGWLALGSAESLYGIDDPFELKTFGKTIVYRKPDRDKIKK